MASGGGGGHDTDINVAKLKILDEGELKKMFQELKPRPQRHVPSSRRNRDRSHLNNLHNVQEAILIQNFLKLHYVKSTISILHIL